MKNIFSLSLLFMITLSLPSCKPQTSQDPSDPNFKYTIDQFSDCKVMRYTIPGWEDLSLKEKELVYYLSQAALCGRDILYDQKFKHNLHIRRTLESIYSTYAGDKQDDNYHQFETYLKKVWFSNGIHHHYSTDKFLPEFSKDYWQTLLQGSDLSSVLEEGQSVDDFSAFITPILFDPTLYAKGINLDAAAGLIEQSAVNFYDGVTTAEAEDFYARMSQAQDPRPLSYGLNAKLIKKDGKVQEQVYKADGLYGPAIREIIFWLDKATEVAENDTQKAHLLKLIEYYRSGDLQLWDEYNVMWVNDLDSKIDYVNGFIETYGEPLGMKATWEAVVNFKDVEATKRTEKISSQAQWFEDHSPVDARFKKKEVKGVSAKVITAAQLGGDCYPTPPIGINLPNADWIRRDHGSKSVTIANLTYAYDRSAQEGKSATAEFACNQEEIDLHSAHGALASDLHTDLHECLGHGSGQLLPGTSSEALKNYTSALEETRADLFALYYMMDPKLVELQIMPSLDVAKAEYNTYIRNGLMTQLTRIELGKNIEQAHMRCRSLIAQWCFEKGLNDNVIEKIQKNGKTYFKINDHQKLRTLFGQLLAEVQRIKSEGDYAAGKNLVEKYAVKINPDLHQEVLLRYAKLGIKPYGGFVNPEFKVTQNKKGQITAIDLVYPDNYSAQMMHYSQKYSFLPNKP